MRERAQTRAWETSTAIDVVENVTVKVSAGWCQRQTLARQRFSKTATSPPSLRSSSRVLFSRYARVASSTETYCCSRSIVSAQNIRVMAIDDTRRLSDVIEYAAEKRLHPAKPLARLSSPNR